MTQKTPIRYSPHSGRDRMIKNQSAESYRDKNPRVLWRFNPWTGERRSNGDMRSDPQGHAILPPGEALTAAARDMPKVTNEIYVAKPKQYSAALPPLVPTPAPFENVARDAMNNIAEKLAGALGVQVGGSHYKELAIQPIEYIHKNGIGFAEGSVIKYVSRWRSKGGVEDLKKARHFLDLLIEMEEKTSNKEQA